MKTRTDPPMNVGQGVCMGWRGIRSARSRDELPDHVFPAQSTPVVDLGQSRRHPRPDHLPGRHPPARHHWWTKVRGRRVNLSPIRRFPRNVGGRLVRRRADQPRQAHVRFATGRKSHVARVVAVDVLAPSVHLLCHLVSCCGAGSFLLFEPSSRRSPAGLLFSSSFSSRSPSVSSRR